MSDVSLGVEMCAGLKQVQVRGNNTANLIRAAI